MKFVSLVKKAPVSIILLTTLWALWASQGGDHLALRHTFGLRATGDLNFLHMFTSGLTSATLQGVIGASVGVLTLGLAAERTLGSARFAMLSLAMHVVFAPFGLWFAHVSAPYLESIATASTSDYLLSPGAWIFGTSMFATAFMSPLWKRRLRLAGFVVTATQTLFLGNVTNTVALISVVGGIIAGSLVAGRGFPRMRTLSQPSARERRILVAVLFGTVAITPVLIGTHPTASGLFADANFLIWQPYALAFHADWACTSNDLARCAAMGKLVTFEGPSNTIANLVPVIIQLIFAWGLVRAKRAAWIGGIVSTLATMTIVIIQFIQIAFLYGDLSTVLTLATFSLTPWLVVLMALLATRKLYTVCTSSKAYTRAIAFVVGGIIAAAAIWFIGTAVFSTQFTPEIGASQAFGEFFVRLLPPIASLLLPLGNIPAGIGAWFAFIWTGTIFWILVAIAMYFLVVDSHSELRFNDRIKARQILENGTGDHLSFMTLWDGNSYFFHELGYVAYRVSNGVAVTLGGPVFAGHSDSLVHDNEESASAVDMLPSDANRHELASAFEEFVQKQGWQIAWYSVNEDFTRPGFKKLHVAEEGVLSADTKFTGKKFQNVRTAKNNAKKEGIEAIWTDWESLDIDMRARVTALSEQWVAEKALPEMGFTLGALDELKIPGTKIMLAVDQSCHLHGITSWLPVYEGGQLVGYTLDFMRRDSDGWRSVIEFLLGESVPKINELGLKWVSLSGAPLARSEAIEDPSFLDIVLERTGALIEPLYGFRSLAGSKYKFNPDHHGWYLAYNDELALGKIGMAISHCYLPGIGPKGIAEIVRVYFEAQKQAKIDEENKARRRAEVEARDAVSKAIHRGLPVPEEAVAVLGREAVAQIVAEATRTE
ncbi:bifunctional lysylphosphatidylglycerol flippase/synthetase MprF [Arcanobacterium canis]